MQNYPLLGTNITGELSTDRSLSLQNYPLIGAYVIAELSTGRSLYHCRIH